MIPSNRDSITIHWSRAFHIVFVELFNSNYYLTVVQKTYNRSATIIKTLTSSDRCEHINELFNETIIKLHLLRRIKYYHVPCQRRSPQLSCFYDDIHLCLCDNYDQQRQANCFKFDHRMNFDCFGKNNCENGAQCFQDSATCPQTSMCVCPTCFYGQRCQFSTNGFGLSLDTILSYHILPHVSILHQPFAVQISAVLALVMLAIGLVNGVLSVITFKKKNLREVGCGLYLLCSSITTRLTMTALVLKFWIFFCAQMVIITNRSFLHSQCISIDFILRIGLSTDQWLNACVATERAVVTMKGIDFDKKKSKKVAKYMIVALLLLTIDTAIHDPIHRHLIEDGDQKRIWCIVTYSRSVQIFNSIVNIFHIFVPFIINLISGLMIIRTNVRQRGTIQTDKQLLRGQSLLYSHLLIAPFLLVILASPRLIVSFVSGCIKSPEKFSLLLAGYFISFIPTMLTFVLFVLSSKAYTEVFHNSVRPNREMLQTRSSIVS